MTVCATSLTPAAKSAGRRFVELLVSLAWRDVRVRYKQSLLGVAWAVLLPLTMMLVFTFVFTRAVRVVEGLDASVPYPLYAYTGLVPWAFFSMAVTGGVNSLVANRNLVTKIYFPREVFPLSCVASGLVDFAIASAVVLGLIGYFHVTSDWSFRPTAALAWLPVVLAVQVTLTAGLGMALAMANLFYRDVRPVVTVLLQLWLFISGVVVPVPRDGSWLAQLIALNPLVAIFGSYRDCLLHGRAPEAGPLLYAAAVAVVVLVAGAVVFRRASYRFAECI